MMDDYTREMRDLKTLVTRTLEKKGVLAKIRAELRASVFEAIEEEDRVIENNEGLPLALLGSCTDRARQLHALPSGRLLCALVCEYLEWAQLDHMLKVYQPECNLDSWKSELNDFSSNHGYELNRNGDSAPLLLDVLEVRVVPETKPLKLADVSQRLMDQLGYTIEIKPSVIYCTSLNWSADGSTLFSGFSDGVIRVWGIGRY